MRNVDGESSIVVMSVLLERRVQQVIDKLLFRHKPRLAQGTAITVLCVEDCFFIYQPDPIAVGQELKFRNLFRGICFQQLLELARPLRIHFFHGGQNISSRQRGVRFRLRQFLHLFQQAADFPAQPQEFTQLIAGEGRRGICPRE